MNLGTLQAKMSFKTFINDTRSLSLDSVAQPDKNIELSGLSWISRSPAISSKGNHLYVFLIAFPFSVGFI